MSDEYPGTISPERIGRILILGAIGIGNLLLFSASLRALRKAFPGAHIAMIVLKQGFKDLYAADADVNEIIVVDYAVQNTLLKKLKLLRELRRKRFDLCITTFPSNRLEYNLLPFLAGVKYRIGHRYFTKTWRTLSFLQNFRVPVDAGAHDLEQNINLLKPLGIADGAERRLTIGISEKHAAEARRYLADAGFAGAGLIIGIHPGSSVERDMHLKRWGTDKFIALCRGIRHTNGARFLIFGGPEEESVKREIGSALRGDGAIVERVPLLTTAALIGQCRLFISNDSGLMHVAVAMGVPVAALFGPTDPGRTAPYGQAHRVIRLGLPCSPCWSINNVGMGKIRCIFPVNRCLTELGADTALEIVSGMLARMG